MNYGWVKKSLCGVYSGLDAYCLCNLHSYKTCNQLDKRYVSFPWIPIAIREGIHWIHLLMDSGWLLLFYKKVVLYIELRSPICDLKDLSLQTRFLYRGIIPSSHHGITVSLHQTTSLSYVEYSSLKKRRRIFDFVFNYVFYKIPEPNFSPFFIPNEYISYQKNKNRIFKCNIYYFCSLIGNIKA
jgi:hypothetical protein